MLDRSEVSPHRKILLFLQNQLFSELWGGRENANLCDVDILVRGYV